MDQSMEVLIITAFMGINRTKKGLTLNCYLFNLPIIFCITLHRRIDNRFKDTRGGMMSKNEGKGSILLKLLILILVAGLIAVIIIPGQIWEEEAREMNTAHYNMMSLYESEKFFHRLNDRYTTDPQELINVVRQDSSLLQLQQVVNYTQEIKDAIDSYRSNLYIKSLLDIDQNMRKILDDLESNRRNFRMNEAINNEAEDLKLKISELRAATEFSNFASAANYLDTLSTIRRDLSNYPLQTIALRASMMTDTLKSLIGQINLQELASRWAPLSQRIGAFIKSVKRSEIVYVSSVADRVEDFKKGVDNAFERAGTLDINQQVGEAVKISDKLAALYQKFLGDFIVTSKVALLRLSEEDSLVLHLTEDNFFSPVSGDRYKFIFNEDSSAIKIESPVLLSELKEKAAPIINKINETPVLPVISEYLDTLDAIQTKAYNIRKKLRRNTDIFIQFKELEEIIKRFSDISVVDAYENLNIFVSKTADGQSYSDIKMYTENALNGVRIFKQAYTQDIFGNLDSLHRDVVNNLNGFNELMAQVRRMPKGVQNFEADIQLLNDLKSKIRSIKSETLISRLAETENALGDLFLFASEGKSKRVYGVFEKKIRNFGYIFKDTRSWEEEESK